MIALPSVVGYCVFPFMHGALLSLVAFVLSGLAPAAPAPAARTALAGAAEVVAPRAVAACDADAAELALETSAEEPMATPVTFAPRRAELASPAEIGCALVFRNTSAVDHASALHLRPSSAGDVRLWSCDESALRVFNAWYRVSRFPEAESPRALSLQASVPASAVAHLDGSRAALSGGNDLHRASESFAWARGAGSAHGAQLVPPVSRPLTVFAPRERPPSRTLAALERPPRTASL